VDDLEQMRLALELGLRDYLDKNGFRELVVGVSGGIDSALTVALAVEALGPERVHAVSMPSRFLRFDPKTEKRTLYFEGTSKFLAKVRQPLTAKRIPKFIENPTMASIFIAMRGEPEGEM